MGSLGRFRYLEAQPARAAGPGPFAPTLILLHAFPLNARMWEPQRALADHGWQVIAPHLRGFDGGCEDRPASSVDDYAGDVIDLLDSLGIEDAVIGGLSMGGYVALAIVRHAPRYVRGLVLADTRSEADAPEGVEGRRRMLQLLEERGPAAVADDMIPKLLGATTRATRPEIAEHVRSLVLANPSEAIAGAIRALMTCPDSTALLHSIHCPTLILVGDEDTLTPRAMSEAMHQKIGGSQLVAIPGAGHLSSLEQPDTFNDHLAHFLTHRV